MRRITYLILLLAAGSAFAQDDCNLQYDGNGDGAVNVEDVLGVLSEFGEVCEPPGFVTCGDNISFDGYSYSTVLIGDQCWLQENLRTEIYTNGDSIPSNLSNLEWQFAEDAQAIYGETGQVSGGVADAEYNLESFGRLYNWNTVNDPRNLCPSNWHIPTKDEWLILLNLLGTPDDDFEGDFFYSVGYHLKSSPSDTPPWNGLNSAGFSGLPGGKRNYNGMFDWGDEHGVYWSSTPNTSNDLSAWRLLLSDSDGDLSAASLFLVDKRNGLSVRCIMD